METYVAFLRGINVGGRNRMKMNELKTILVEDGFKDVTTYIQSGNLIFNSKELNNEQRISDIILKNLGLEVKVIIRKVDELIEILRSTPYKDGLHYITFINESPNSDNVESLMKVNGRGDFLTVNGNNVYVYPNGEYHKTVFSNSFLEKKLNVYATTRNTKVLGEIIELAKKSKV